MLFELNANQRGKSLKWNGKGEGNVARMFIFLCLMNFQIEKKNLRFLLFIWNPGREEDDFFLRVVQLGSRGIRRKGSKGNSFTLRYICLQENAKRRVSVTFWLVQGGKHMWNIRVCVCVFLGGGVSLKYGDTNVNCKLTRSLVSLMVFYNLQ